MQAIGKIAIIGSGISGLSAAATLGAIGHKVMVFEKNDQHGGRLRQFTEQGFTFDMGPSWYWMPDVFEKFYQKFGHTTSDFYNLKQLDPGFQVIYRNSEVLKVPANWNSVLELFESIEKGAAHKLQKFMIGAEYKYRVGVGKLIYQPGLSVSELLNRDTLKALFNLQLFSSFSSHVRSYFKDERLISLMEFPVLFLGAKPENTPALYSLMNYACLRQGTYYPMGGFKKVVDALLLIGRQNGVEYHSSEPVSSIDSSNGLISIVTDRRNVFVDALIASSDYHHTESQLLNKRFRNYSNKFWEGRTFAPSALLFYAGIGCKVDKLEHHNLFFDEDFANHTNEIYGDPRWPEKPLFYICCPSKTDPTTAPAGKENIFILMPIAAGLEDNDATRQHYLTLILQRLQKFTGTDLTDRIEYLKSYCLKDFVKDYNSYKGNAYGLANTLAQTANLRPKIRNRNLPNFYYAGQLTVPGPGVPPAIISGQIAAVELNKNLKRIQ